MNPEKWERIQLIFDKALKVEKSKRIDFVKNKCGYDIELFEEIISLLNADENEHQIFSASATDYIIIDDTNLDGQTFGNYRTIKQIGTGGMGTVYLAERADGHFEQKVALKVVKPGINSNEIISRFEDERQILARLQHPNIARLLDGGISDIGLPYFTMEYVDGLSITEYCDSKNLTIEERLELFQKVCNAILYAHQNLVIHRDIKPSNILVQDDGTVKLLDFGIAKVFEEEENQKNITRTGIRAMTPEYASPEQILGQPISTATDVYSLGLILYQLLTGYPPYEVNSTSAIEMEKVICLTDPPKPSTMFTKVMGLKSYDGKNLSPDYISEKRRISFTKLKKRISGDLDNICLMALRKEPERRYNSVAQLTTDINNHLAGLPIIARKNTAVYRTKKFVRRHTAGVSIASAAVIVVASLTTLYTIQLAGERDKARLEAEKSQKVSEFLVSLFKVSDPANSKGESITARELLDNGVMRIENELANQPKILANMLNVTGNVYKSLGLYDKSQSLLVKANFLNDSLFGSDSPEAAASLNSLAGLFFVNGDYDKAAKEYKRVIQIRKNIFGENSLELSESINDYAMVLREQGKYDEAEKLLLQALSIREKFSNLKKNEIAESKTNLALVYQDKGEYEKSKSLYKEALKIREVSQGKIHPAYSEALGFYAFLLQDMGNYNEAGKLFKEALDIDEKLYGAIHPMISTDLYYLASNVAFLGDLDSAQALYEKVLELDKKLLGENHPYIALDLNNLAGVLNDKGDSKKAEELYKQSLQLNRKAYGNEHPEVATSLSNLGVLYNRIGRYDEAEPLLKQALNMRIKLLGPEHPSSVTSLNIYASLLTNQHKYKLAVDQYRQTVALRIKLLGKDHPITANAYTGLGNALILSGNYDEAEKNIKSGIDILKNKLPENHWQISYSESLLGKCFTNQKKYKEAEVILLHSYKNLYKVRGEDDRYTKSALKLLVKNYEQSGNLEEAKKLKLKLN